MSSRSPMISLEHVSLSVRPVNGPLFRRVEAHHIVKDVSLEVPRGGSVAIVGASGAGKTTLLRLMLGHQSPTSGNIRIDGRDVDARGDLRWLQSRTGMVFQDPATSFNPRRSIGESVAEPLEALGAPGEVSASDTPNGLRESTPEHRASLAREALARMDLPDDAADRLPADLSGGQRQRAAIARALIHRPAILFGDEPVSALDVLVRATLLDYFARLRADQGLTLVTVTHDLGIVPQLADSIVVMDQGRIVEQGSTEQILRNPVSPVTRALLDARPALPQGTWRGEAPPAPR